MRGKFYNGHSLYKVNYYNSFPLASEFQKRSTYCTGTLRANVKYGLYKVKEVKLKKGEMIERYAEEIVIAKWKGKHKVIYLSTEFENILGQSINRR